MTQIERLTTLALVGLLVVGMAVPATATVGSAVSDQNGSPAASEPPTSETNNSSVNVTVGQQLSTVVAATSDEVQTDFEDTAFDVAYETANETERTEAIVERAEALRERAERVGEDYREATAAYRTGDLNKSEYAQRLAVLNARAQNIIRSYERLQDRSQNVSALALRTEGINRTALNQSIESLDTVTGSGPSALLDRYTGQGDGELSVETENGLTIEAESEDGERSLEIERSRDDDDSVTVAQSDALETARSALQTSENYTWTLTESSVHADSGYYGFEFAFRAGNASGEAEVHVDGSSGSVFKLEQEVEPADEGDDEDERGNETDDDRELALVVSEGTPAPNASITVTVLSAGEPAANATIFVDDAAVGTTGDAGTVTLTLPEESATVKAVRGEQEAELEFEFEDSEDEVFRQLNVTGSVDNGTASISVTYDGAPVSGAAVYANEQRVGTTGADGTVTFGTNATEELEVEVVKGEFEAELTFTVSGETLTLAEEPHEGDGDKAEQEDGRESDEEDEEEGDEEEEDEEEEDEEEEDEDGKNGDDGRDETENDGDETDETDDEESGENNDDEDDSGESDSEDDSDESDSEDDSDE